MRVIWKLRASLVEQVRSSAAEERRSVGKQVEVLLEEALAAREQPVAA